MHAVKIRHNDRSFAILQVEKVGVLYMLTNRREVLKKSTLVAGLMLQSLGYMRSANAYQQNAFEAKTILDVYKNLGLSLPAESKQISLITPEIAENGSVVQVAANTSFGNIKRWIFMVEKNPVPLIAIFNMTDDMAPAVTLRCKFAQTSEFIAVAQLTDGKVHFAKKEVKVTLGGCGG